MMVESVGVVGDSATALSLLVVSRLRSSAAAAWAAGPERPHRRPQPRSPDTVAPERLQRFGFGEFGDGGFALNRRAHPGVAAQAGEPVHIGLCLLERHLVGQRAPPALRSNMIDRHIATATATPSVLLFGPIPPSRWGPGGRGRHITVWAGDRGDPHRDRPHRGLLLITPTRVLEASRSILSEAA